VTLHFLAKLVNNSTSLKIVQCVQEEVRVIVDTESDVNIIKLSELRKEVLINEKIIYELKGINSQPVFTIGSVVLKVQLGTKQKDAEFQVVHDNFPITELGILGAPFFNYNGISINIRNSSLSTEDPKNPENLASPEPPESVVSPIILTIQPRSETLIPILTERKTAQL